MFDGFGLNARRSQTKYFFERFPHVDSIVVADPLECSRALIHTVHQVYQTDDKA